jgi:MYXO-CTERM domain-containing protein
LVLCLSPAVGFAADGGDAGDAGGGCANSNECATPNPHCHPTLHACVECIGDRNCKAGQICRVDEGVCVECRSDVDCNPLRPYCVSSRGECVECLTTANCGDSGVSCQSGKCGSCGDGICGPREVIYRDFGPTLPDDGIVVCNDDCDRLCPSKDTGSGFGVFSIPTSGLRNLIVGGCAIDPDPRVEAFFKWTAPHAGSFSFTPKKATLLQLEGGCTGFLSGCSIGGSGSTISATAGQEIVVALEPEDPAATTIELEISAAVRPGCDSSPCDPPDAGKEGAALCLANAQDRGDPMCSGVECACNHCPRDYDDCKVIPGCRQILDCMEQKNCIGAECYNSGACRSVVDTYGGISGPAFRASSGLKSCALSFQCGLPCASDAGDAAPPLDAGQLCTPDASVVCSCGDRSGTKRCTSDAMQFGSCNCAVPPAEAEDDDGCGCRLAGSGGSTSLGATFALLAFAASRRRRRNREHSPAGGVLR